MTTADTLTKERVHALLPVPTCTIRE